MIFKNNRNVKNWGQPKIFPNLFGGENKILYLCKRIKATILWIKKK